MTRTTRLTLHRSTALGADERSQHDFHARLAAVTRAAVLDSVGLEGLATTARLRRSTWAGDDTHRFEAALLTDAGGRDIGAWVLEVPLRENLRTASAQILTPTPRSGEATRARAHAALIDDLFARVREHGRTVVFTHDVIGAIDGTSVDPLVLTGTGAADRLAVIGPEGASAAELVPVRSGAGRLLSADPPVRRMIEAGFEPVQVTRMSVLDVSEDGSCASGACAPQDPVLPDGVRAVSWVEDTPAQWAPQMAELYCVFEQTVPAGGAAFAPEVWDVARLRESEATARAAGIVRIVSAVAQEDRLLAFTLFEQTPGSPIVFQEHTVVRPEARGRGLAVAVKRVNADHLRRVSPDARTVCTWNAAENLPMLAVNNASGFVPRAWSVLWEAVLADPADGGSAGRR